MKTPRKKAAAERHRAAAVKTRAAPLDEIVNAGDPEDAPKPVTPPQPADPAPPPTEPAQPGNLPPQEDEPAAAQAPLGGPESAGPASGTAATQGAVSRYETRIRVQEAFKYPGSLAVAPRWIDRTWASYADADPARGIPAGPALRVPASNPEGFTFCRVGDYVVKADIQIADGVSDERIEAWNGEVFEKLFFPVGKAEQDAATEGLKRTMSRGGRKAKAA